jgi:purine-binding chemotaxis protein CheW
MTSATTKVTGKTETLAGKYLTFRLGAEEFGLEILKVQEIIKMMDITRVPRMPEYMRGVINLRGKVIPVIDLRLKFDMESRDTTDKTCVIVVQISHEGAQKIMGVVVDEVSEVLDVGSEQIEPPPQFDATVESQFILGMGKIGKKVVMLLDVDRILGGAEMDVLSTVRA